VGSEVVEGMKLNNSRCFKQLEVLEKIISPPTKLDDIGVFDIVESKKKIQKLSFGVQLTLNLHNKLKKKMLVDTLAKSIAEIKKKPKSFW